MLLRDGRGDLFRPLKCLSRMTGNCHVRFLGGKGPQGPALPGTAIGLDGNFRGSTLVSEVTI
jgi:hypothetical protein